MKKIIFVDSKEKCSGCGACAYVCPVNAITYLRDEEGFLYPHINKEKCIECGKCLRKCHLQDTAEKIEVCTARKQYAVKMKDENRRKHSRSGGIFAALSDIILSHNGVVYGAVLENVGEVVHKRAENTTERDRMCGSKYVQSDTTKIYSELYSDLEEGRMVLFSGTPCQIAAISKIFKKDRYPNLYLCDFVCHGVPSPKLWADYLQWAERRYKDKIIGVDFRDKQKHSWESHVEKLQFKRKLLWSRRYTNIFYSNNCLRRSCYTCTYTTPIRISDYTIADYWGIDEVIPEFNDGKGISLLIIRTSKGEHIFGEAEEGIEYIDTSKFEPCHYNLKRPTSCPKTREDFWRDYHKRGFGYVSRKYGGYDLLHRIKYKLIDHID